MMRDYTKIGIAAALFVFLIFLGAQIVKFSGRRQEALTSYKEAKAEYDATLADHEALEDDFRYFSDPNNLSKELRARFNYTLPGEKMIILVQEGDPSAEGN